jgi:hypothetical protein
MKRRRSKKRKRGQQVPPKGTAAAIRALDPRVSREQAWVYFDEMDHLEFSRNQKRVKAITTSARS